MDNTEHYVEVENRRFVVKKFPAKVALRISKTILANVLPNVSSFMQEDEIQEVELYKAIGNALKGLADEDLDKIIDTSLYYCFEELAAGKTRVFNDNKTYGVTGVEEDLVLTLRLVTESLIFNFKGFLNASRWNSILTLVPDTYQPTVKM